MSTSDTSPSSNGRPPETWLASWTHMRVDRRTRSYCRVTFDHPPFNAITATTVAELSELVDLIEQDPDLDVVVFDSASPDHFLGRQDTEHDLAAWLDVLVRLACAPVVSIASIRGRAGGAGGAFVLACDLRFAARENIVLGPFDAGAGRALEIRLVDDDRLDMEVDELAARLGQRAADALPDP